MNLLIFSLTLPLIFKINPIKSGKIIKMCGCLHKIDNPPNMFAAIIFLLLFGFCKKSNNNLKETMENNNPRMSGFI
jgi:hypothetical protein